MAKVSRAETADFSDTDHAEEIAFAEDPALDMDWDSGDDEVMDEVDDEPVPDPMADKEMFAVVNKIFDSVEQGDKSDDNNKEEQGEQEEEAPISAADADRARDSTALLNSMDNQLIKDARTFQSAEALGRWLHFSSGRELDDWIAKDPVIVELARIYNHWRAKFSTVRQQIRAVTAENSIDLEETPERRRFSKVTEEDKATWTAREYHAYMLFCLVQDHCELSQGRFHPRKWARHIARNRMWLLIQRIKKKHPVQRGSGNGAAASSSKVGKGEEQSQPQTTISTTSGQTPSRGSKSDVQNPRQSVTKNFKDKLQGLSKEQRTAVVQAFEDKQTRKLRRDTAVIAAAKDVALEKTDHQETDIDDKEGDTQDKFSKEDSRANALAQLPPPSLDVLKLAEKFAKNDTREMSKSEQEKLFKALAEELSEEEFYDAIVLPHMPQQATFKSRMTPDEIRDAFRKVALLLNDKKNEVDVEAKAQKWDTATAQKVLAERIQSLEDFVWYQRVKSLRAVLAPADDPATMPHEDAEFFTIGSQFTIDKSMAEQGIARDAYQLEHPTQTDEAAADNTVYTVGDDEDNASSRRISRLLENTTYERTDLIAACKQLGLDPEKAFRLPTMRQAGIILYWWQVCEVASMRTMLEGNITRGCILGSAVGLGKTFSIGATILSYHQELLLKISKINRNEMDAQVRKKALQELGPNKPWLVVVPSPSLLVQWSGELTLLSPYFEIIVYHGDRSVNTATKLGYSTAFAHNVQRINKVLVRTSPRLTPKDRLKIRIFLTTSPTFANRHGPSALHTDRQKKLLRQYNKRDITEDAYNALTKAATGPIFATPDKNWPFDLSGIFAGVVKDEAHDIRNPDSMANIAIRWLDAPKLILATATPIWNDTPDLKGYLPHLATLSAIRDFRELYKASKQDPKGVHNPYLTANRERARDANTGELSLPIRQRSLCPEVFDKYAKHSGSVAAGASAEESQEIIEAVFEDVLIRHSYSSSCPPGEPRFAIGHNLPECFRYLIKAHMDKELKDLYKFYAAPHIARYRMPVKNNPRGNRSNQNDMVINSNANRALTLGSTWPLLMLIGIPKKHPTIADQIERLEQNRHLHVDRVKEAHANKILAKLEEEGIEADCDDDGALEANKPSEEIILQKLWYKHGEEYSLMELDISAFLKQLHSTAPKNVDRDVWLLHGLMDFASKNTQSVANEEVTVFNGAHYLVGLPELKRKPPRDWAATIAKFVAKTSPCLHTIAALAYEATKRREKASLWCSYPSTQLIIQAFLSLFGLQSELFISDLEVADRDTLIRNFNNPAGSVDFLVCSYQVGGVGLNLHKASHLLFLVDAPENVAQLEQVIGRAYRLGQEWDVHVYIIEVPDSHDKKQNTRSLIRAAGELRSRIDARELAKQTGARVPDHVTEAEFFRYLKATMDGFYYNDTVVGPLALRHETAFPEVEDEDGGIGREIPAGYEPITGSDLTVMVHNMLKGLNIKPVVEQKTEELIRELQADMPAKGGTRSKAKTHKGKGPEPRSLQTSAPVLMHVDDNTRLDTHAAKTTVRDLERVAKRLDVAFPKSAKKAEKVSILHEAFKAEDRGRENSGDDDEFEFAMPDEVMKERGEEDGVRHSDDGKAEEQSDEKMGDPFLLTARKRREHPGHPDDETAAKKAKFDDGDSGGRKEHEQQQQ